MQLSKHAMQTISDDGTFYFHLTGERETVFLASIPDGIHPGETDTREKKEDKEKQ